MISHEKASKLSSFSLFKYIDKSHLGTLTEIFNYSKPAVGSYIITENETVDRLVFVVDGFLEVLAGGSDEVLSVVPKGASIGEMSLVEDNSKASASIRVPNCNCGILEVSFADLIEKAYPVDSFKLNLFRGMSEVLSKRIRYLNFTISSQAEAGNSLTRSLLDKYQIESKLGVVKEDVFAIESKLLPSLEILATTVQRHIKEKKAIELDSLINLQEIIEKLMLEDMQAFDFLSQRINLINQYFENVKSAALGSSVKQIDGDSRLFPPAATRSNEEGFGNVLIVDDEPEILEIVEENLRELGIEAISTCTSVAEAVKIFEEKQPVLVITDIHIPDVSGIELIRIIRKLSREVGIVAITGNLDEERFNMAKTAGANAFIEKPFRFKEIKDLVDRFIADRS